MLYRLFAILLTPLVRWGRVKVEGLELVPRTGPVLLVPNHDSQMDPVLIGLALGAVRPVRFLARSNLWQIPGLGVVLSGLGQIPIQRGAGDHAAIAEAVSILHAGEAVCVFPEGQLSGGQSLRARTGVVRLSSACPHAHVVLCAITGATDYVRFPRRPRVTLRFLQPSGGPPGPDENARDAAARLLADTRALAPQVPAGRRHSLQARPAGPREPGWSITPLPSDTQPMRDRVTDPHQQSLRPVVPSHTVADVIAPIIGRLGFDRGSGLPFSIRFWDSSEIPATTSTTTLVIHRREALEHVLREPNELGLARAWVAGDLNIEGGVENGLASAEDLRGLRLGIRDRLALAAVAVRLGAVRLRRPPIPACEARLAGRRKSLRRDRDAIAYHYDMPDSFYELVLGSTRGYTCGYYQHPDDSLEDAQLRKFDRVCSKLELRPGERLLDIGCGWGTLMIHAARHYGARVVGVTISESQADEVRRRIRAAGVADQCEVRLCDWREIDDGPYDKLASVEMIEHVGAANLPRFFATARSLLAPGGMVFTQAMVRDARRNLKDSRFITRYIFPDGEIVSFNDLLDAMTSAGMEVRDLESLRAHYPTTLRAWAANLDGRRDEAIDLVGIERVRAWDIYLAASTLAFDRGALSVHQILAATPPARTSALLSPRPRTDHQRWDQIKNDAVQGRRA